MSGSAPDLPGLTFVSPLGSGGYADVHAYDQALPARRVAVKVLREPAHVPADAAAFLAEANAMAALEHPFIVPVYSAGLAPDGRPYLVMQLCPGPNLGVRSRREPLGVAEVLRVGVQIGGAVETAHRRGLLHRDIKPVNILTDAYGAPLLTDFGLAGTPTDADDPELAVSVPWAAPEVLFGTAPASVRSDVYSLAATLWTLLVGRSPFELDGQDTAVRMLRRIRSQPAPSTGRPDVPSRLEEALAAGLAKDAAARPASVLDLVRSLQDVQRDLGEPVTEPLVADPVAAPPVPPAPRPTPPTPAPQAPPPPRPAPDPRVASVLSAPPPRPAPSASVPPAPDAAAVIDPAVPGRRPRALGIVLVVLALAAGLAIGWFVLGPGVDRAPAVQITGTRAGDRVTFTWTWTPRSPGDTFNVRVRDKILARSQPTIDLVGAGRQCIAVQVVDARGAARGAYSEEGCAG